MNVTQTKFTIKNFPKRRSILLRARHGLGKSEVVRQCAAELSIETGIQHELIDIRLSQREPGDIIGYPESVPTFDLTKTVYQSGKPVQVVETIQNVMLHNLPVWFPRNKDAHGILFLDELDRAQRESQQAGFEMVLDYRLNLHDLPENIRVVAAINAEDIYSVLPLDLALINRFLVVDFKPTVAEWMDHAGSMGVHDSILKYLAKIPTDLDSPLNMEPGKIYQSRRSWVMLSDAIKSFLDKGHNVLKDLDYLVLLARGYLSGHVAESFTDFIRKDYKIYTPQDILEDWSQDMSLDFMSMLPNEVMFYGRGLTNYINDQKIVALNPKQSENMLNFFLAISREAQMGFWQMFISSCRKVATKWATTNQQAKDLVSSVWVNQ